MIIRLLIAWVTMVLLSVVYPVCWVVDPTRVVVNYLDSRADDWLGWLEPWAFMHVR